jgi:type IVB pilus formation R64 PilN family outer membrane protein
MWQTLAKTAQTVAGSGGMSDAQVSVDPAMASVTVTGTPTQVRNVKEWVDKITDHLSQLVLITETFAEVDLDSEDYGNWNPSAIYNKMSSIYGLSIVGAGGPPVSGSLSPMIISATGGSSSKLDGSTLALSALSTVGHISSSITRSAIGLNDQPAQIQIGNEVTYLASSGTTLASNVGSTSQLTPGVVTPGFTAFFLPQIINGRILLSVDTTNSTLNGITTVTSNGSSIETPNLSSVTFQQSISLASGSALLLAGLQEEDVAVNRSGTGSAYNPLLGGGIDGTRAKKLIAVIISARVL